MSSTIRATLADANNRAENPAAGPLGYIIGWIASSSLLLGLLALWSNQSSLLPLFFTAGYLALLVAIVRVTDAWSDICNPLFLVLAIGFFRFSCAGLLLMSGAAIPEQVQLFFQVMNLSDSDWEWGHALALIGMLALVLGWILTQPRWAYVQQLRFQTPDGVRYASIAGMLVGFVGLSAFFFSNASLDVISTGTFRESQIHEGTGKYFYMSYLLIAGSVCLSCSLLRTGNKRLSLIPVVASMVLYSALGGRGRAMTALAAGLLLIWYVGREQSGWRRIRFRPRYVLLASIGVFVAVWFLYIGAIYRGGMGTNALSESLSISGLLGYVESSIFTDIGQLHSLAAAIAIGPGVLGGQTFIGSLTWPLDKFLPIPGRSAGVFIVETLVGFGTGRKWGVNASLIGDAYLNLGLGGVVVVMSVYGAVLKLLYLKFRQGSFHVVLYTLALLSGLQIFWVSIEVWPQAVTTLAFAFFLMTLGKSLFQVR